METLAFSGDDLACRLSHWQSMVERDGVRIWRGDANGCAPIYYDAVRGAVSVSPLELARRAGLRPDPVCCASFLCNGNYYHDRVFHPDLKPLRPGWSVEETPGVERGPRLEPVDPCLPWRAGARGGADALIDALLAAVEPLRGKRVLCDITGGLDSRLILLVLRRAGIPFTGCVGGPDGSPDVLLAKRIAGDLDIELLRNPAQRPDDEALWREGFRAGGACVSMRLAAVLEQINDQRQAFDVSVGGLGGELLRDFWWLQEPTGLDANESPNWGRLVRHRLYGSPLPADLLKGAWAEALVEEPEAMALCLDAETRELPLTRKRDRLDYAYLRRHLPRWAGASIAMGLRRSRMHSPILDPAVLAVTFATSTRERRLGRMVRSAIEKLDRRVAAIPIESGGNALALSGVRPWRYLPLYGRLLRSARRHLSLGMGKTVSPAWGDRPLRCERLVDEGVVDVDALRRYAGAPGSLATLERLLSLEHLFAELDGDGGP